MVLRQCDWQNQRHVAAVRHGEALRKVRLPPLATVRIDQQQKDAIFKQRNDIIQLIWVFLFKNLPNKAKLSRQFAKRMQNEVSDFKLFRKYGHSLDLHKPRLEFSKESFQFTGALAWHETVLQQQHREFYLRTINHRQIMRRWSQKHDGLFSENRDR